MEIDSDCSVEFLDRVVIDNCATSKRSKTDENIIELDDDCYILSENNTFSLQENNNLLNGNTLKKVCSENNIFAVFVEKCFEIENSTGMSRVLNKTLLNIYQKTDDNFKTSPLMKKLLNNAINSLDVDPNHRFLHVKTLCEGLKLHGVKKRRAKLTTLATNLKDKKSKTTEKRKRSFIGCDLSKSNDVIDLDMEVTELPIIDVDEDQSDVILIGDLNNVNEKENVESKSLTKRDTKSLTSNKDNNKKYFINLQEVEVEFEPLEIVELVQYNVKHTCSTKENETKSFGCTTATQTPTNKSSTELANQKASNVCNCTKLTQVTDKSCTEHANKEETKCLKYPTPVQVSNKYSTNQTNKEATKSPNYVKAIQVPNKCSGEQTNKEATRYFDNVTPVPVPACSDIEKIKAIESEIARCKQEIAELDKQEVVSDTIESPYLLSEKLKARIVALYKQLCQITGSEVVKQRKVHLQVLKGYPPGPVKILEKFLNDNLRSDGHPPFPDLYDVVRCVTKANDHDNLGWNKARIMDEARALFIQCGQALQKRRQAREYRDLMSKIKMENSNKDPADEDPDLLARLEMNRRIGTKKETDLLERFSIMQNTCKTNSLVKWNSENNIKKSFCKEIEYGRIQVPESANIENLKNTTANLESEIGNHNEKDLKISSVVSLNTRSMSNEFRFANIQSKKIKINDNEHTTTEVVDSGNHKSTTANIERQTVNNSENELKISEVVSLSTRSVINENVANIESGKIKNINNEYTKIKVPNSDYTTANIERQIVNHNENGLKISKVVSLNTSCMINEHVGNIESQKDKNINNEYTATDFSNIVNQSYTTAATEMQTINHSKIELKISEVVSLNTRSMNNTYDSGSIESKETENFKNECSTKKRTPLLHSCNDESVVRCILKQQEFLYNSSSTSEDYSYGMINYKHNRKVIVNDNEKDPKSCLNHNIKETRITKIHNSCDKFIESGENAVTIKKEPGETLRLLEQIGDNYTTAIVDIEDPFIIIDISDSSDSEDDSR